MRERMPLFLSRLGMVAAIALVALAGCAAGPRGSDDGDAADPVAARRHVQAGVALLREGHPEQARKAFEMAVEADPRSGIAWNDLGLVFYGQHRYYDAARAFERAAQLLPRRPEPHNNLGLVFEKGRQYDAAVRHYEKALRRDPDNPQVIGNLARARIRRGDDGPDLRQLLQRLILIDSRPEWTTWANRHLATFPGEGGGGER